MVCSRAASDVMSEVFHGSRRIVAIWGRMVGYGLFVSSPRLVNILVSIVFPVKIRWRPLEAWWLFQTVAKRQQAINLWGAKRTTRTLMNAFASEIIEEDALARG